MKRIIIFVAAVIFTLHLSPSTLNAQEVKIKKGKATMTEEQYNDLKAKADAYDKMQKEMKVLEERVNELSKPAELKTFNDSASYAIGRDIFNQWKSQNLGIDGRAAGQAMIDGAKNTNRLNDKTAHTLLQRFQQAFEERQNASVQENIDAGAKYMHDISRNKSVYETKTGLKYRMVKSGNGKKPKATDRVKVHYTGRLIDGTVFDSSIDRGEPITFALNQVIPGWTEGLQLMDEGSKYMLYIPYNLGYGKQQAGTIPPGSTLVFEVELLEINPKK
jgi:FKBP-type peptidyl-prolyl cis-trans isomerase